MTVAGKIGVLISLAEGKALDLGNANVPLERTYQTILANGTGAGQVDRIFHDTRTISASSNDDLDLAGVLTDTFGATLTFVKVKGIVVVAAAANTNNVVLGGASNTFSTWLTGTNPAVLVRPGTMFALICGVADTTAYAVTATSADLFRISNSGAGTSVTYDIYIIGTSA